MRKLIYNFLIWIINLTLRKHRKRWYNENAQFGIELGYPKCCVDAFCFDCPEALEIFRHVPTHKENIELRYKAGLIENEYIGFIPCIEHANKILAGETTVQNLIQNRNKDFPEFPITPFII